MEKKLKLQTRKRLTKWASLLCLTFVSVGTIQAQIESYPLKIAGVQVNSSNCNNLSNAIDGVTGEVKYDNSTKTLTLNDADMNISKVVPCIENLGISGFKIELKGRNHLKTTGSTASMIFETNTEIFGEGFLEVKRHIFCKEADLTIKDCELWVNAPLKWGIVGFDNTSQETVTIDHANVRLVGASSGAIVRIGSLELKRCVIENPQGLKFDKTKQALVDANGDIEISVDIRSVEYYGIKICGEEVTDINYNDLTVIDGVSGKVKYDNSKKTLYLEDATIEEFKDVIPACIESGDIDLKIHLTGKNQLNSDRNCLQVKKKATIKGKGKLSLSTRYMGAIWIKSGATLKVAGHTEVTAISEQKNAIVGGELLLDEYGVVKAEKTGGDTDPVILLDKLTLDGSHAIVSPIGARYDSSKKCVVDIDGNPLSWKEIIIKHTSLYNVWIAGVQVNATIQDDLTVIPGVSGDVVKYIPIGYSVEGLVLKNAKIEVKKDVQCIKAEKETIILSGTNTFTKSTGTKSALYLYGVGKWNRISGSGKLEVSCPEGSAIGLGDKTGLSIDGRCTIEAKGKRGIAGSGSAVASLSIYNSTVKATGTEGSIRNIKTLTLRDALIESPAGAEFNETKKAIVDAGKNIIKTEVFIRPLEKFGLKLAGEDVTEVNCNDLSAAIAGVSGTVSYNPLEATLTLDNASIDGSIVNKGVDGLIIELKGENTSKQLHFEKNTELKGEGKLTIDDKTLTQAVKSEDGVLLTVSECHLRAIGKVGIRGGMLKVNHATIEATGAENGSIRDIDTLTLINCAITKPENVKYLIDKKAVVYGSGFPVKVEVIIAPTATTGIENPDSEALKLYPNPANEGFTLETSERGTLEIYSIHGRKIRTIDIRSSKQFVEVGDLQSGLYILKLNGQAIQLLKN